MATVGEITLDLIKTEIRNIPDFPKKGIQFKDITTVLKQPELFSFLIDELTKKYIGRGITKVVCIESRGFILGGAIADRLGAGFVPIRKPGKLPGEVISKEYMLEYGTDRIEIHKDALLSSDVILLHDDLLATGGTARAATELLKCFDPAKIYISFFCELDFLKGREKLKNYEITSLIHF
jgi:adenine phosphoribosyltransferase